MDEKVPHQFDLRVLGILELGGPGAGTPESVLAQPKRLALLCYLALASPRGFHRRDALVALFWPELDSLRARHALSQALHFLRLHLGADVVANRSAEEVGLSSGPLRCDAVEFEEALDRERLTDALEIYGGDLLEAFHVAEAPEFERWLERERTRLRTRAVEAALQLSERCQRAGDPEAATRWARWATGRAPEDEAAVRRLATALEHSGDRAGAIQTLTRFADWLEAELGAPPAAETVALLATLRSGGPDLRVAVDAGVNARNDEGTDASRGPVADAVEAAAEPPPAAATRSGDGDRPVIRRGWAKGWLPSVDRRVTFTLVVLALLGGIGSYHLAAGLGAALEPNEGTAAERFVLVLPLEYHGSDSLAYAAGAATQLLRGNLEGADDLRMIDPRAAAGAAGEIGESGGRVARRELALRFGAGSYIAGGMTESAGHLRLSVSWYSRDGTALVRSTAQGGAAELFGLVDRLTADLLAGREVGPGGRVLRSAARSTESLRALRSFLDGERHFAAGRFGRAAESFQAAVAEDSMFALAHYRLSTAAEYLGDNRTALQAAEIAVRHGEGLQPPTRSLLTALLAARQGDADRAEFLYREILSRQQYQVEAWFQLGEVQFHYGPGSGRPVERSRRAWEAVLEMEPHNVTALYHMARLLALDGDQPALARLVADMTERSPEHERVWAMRALERTTAGEVSARRLVAELRTVDDQTLYMAVFDAITYTADPSAARPLARVLTEPTRPPDVRAWGHLWLAHLELALGRVRSAHLELDRLAALDPLAATEYRALLTLHPLLQPSPETLREAGAQLLAASMIQTPLNSPDFPSAAHPRLRPHLHDYLRALLAARDQDMTTVDRIATAMEAEARPGSPPATMAAALRAVESRAAGELSTAHELLESGRYRGWYEPARWSAFIGQGHERWLMAELLDDLGRPREALLWFVALPQTSPLDVVHRAGAHLRRAEIHERLGEPAAAAEQYARLLDLWQDCDPELRPLLETARQRLRRVRSPTGPRGGSLPP